MIKFEKRETLMEARRLAREAVRQRLKEQGFKVHEVSFKDLCEQAESYLKEHSELIGEAIARLDH
jgi:uncharacterized protein YcgL (UPF0745 family)